MGFQYANIPIRVVEKYNIIGYTRTVGFLMSQNIL